MKCGIWLACCGISCGRHPEDEVKDLSHTSPTTALRQCQDLFKDISDCKEQDELLLLEIEMPAKMQQRAKAAPASCPDLVRLHSVPPPCCDTSGFSPHVGRSVSEGEKPTACSASKAASAHVSAAQQVDEDTLSPMMDIGAFSVMDNVLLANLRWPVSVFNMAGDIMYQNQASRDFMGVVGRFSGDGTLLAGPTASDLQRLFRLDQESLVNLLMTVQLGQDWGGTVKLPVCGHVPDDHSLSPRQLVDALDVAAAALASAPRSRARVAEVSSSQLSATLSRFGSSRGAYDDPPSHMHGDSDTLGTSPTAQNEVQRSSCSLVLSPRVLPIGDALRQLRRVKSFLAVKAPSTHPNSANTIRRCTTLDPPCDHLMDTQPALQKTIDVRRRYQELAHKIGATKSDQVHESTHVLHRNQVWHDMMAKVVRDPRSGQQLIMLTHADVTNKVETERNSAALAEAEHSVLEQLFPRHIIEHMGEAKSHQQGEWSFGGGGGGGNGIGNGGGGSRGSAAGVAGSGDMTVALSPEFDGRSSRLHGASASGNAGECSGLSLKHELLSTSHEQVTILFADIVGFTSMCKCVPPATVMAVLNRLYSALDELVSIFNVYKVETAGDCYIVAGGLMYKDKDGYTSVKPDIYPLHALVVFEFAKAILREASKVVNPVTGEPIQMRIGMHSGPVVSGIVGSKMPRFCLFGDAMNTAQRMESMSRAGAIHVSEPTKRLLPKEAWRSTGGVKLKGLGVYETFFWVPNEQQQ